MDDKTAARIRARNLAAAKRSLKLIAEAVRLHDEDLKAGRIPESSFLVSAQKYDEAHRALLLLDSISDGTAPAQDEPPDLPDGLRDDLGLMIEIFRKFGLVPEEAWDGDTTLARLCRLAYPDGIDRSATPPWDGEALINEQKHKAAQETDPGWPPQSSEDM